MDTENLIREKIAKIAYQYAFLIADKNIDYFWSHFGKKEEKWYYCAEQILALIRQVLVTAPPTKVGGTGAGFVDTQNGAEKKRR